eukprot:CAMPEP_0115259282 /NCGR_PEP_ID=MMETSP0270-20121206/47742_1 /TAXON_ID=71861 /ORGANISM="Scrippsiella trochoidea, Strain CCMP3099" /LENGTH=87 /DNA_ID=CAMNT_0002675083 /DNA_START=112 /DNA_END=375 /DNA_ORIENTATION=+
MWQGGFPSGGCHCLRVFQANLLDPMRLNLWNAAIHQALQNALQDGKLLARGVWMPEAKPFMGNENDTAAHVLRPFLQQALALQRLVR